MQLKEPYAIFYVAGRDEDTLDNDIDTEAIAAEVIAGKGSPYELCLAAATTAAATLETGKDRRAWIEENDVAIRAAGGDKDEAYKHYCAGRIDELAGELDNEVTEILIEDLLEGDEDEDEDEDDDEDEDGD